MVLVCNLTPTFYRYGTTPYAKGFGPELDQTIESLIYRIRIGTPQGGTVEEINHYGIYKNLQDCFKPNAGKFSNPLLANIFPNHVLLRIAIGMWKL